jgi:hypothetical protein
MDAISYEVEGDGSILPPDRGEVVKAARTFRGAGVATERV